jgi:hypothetical protein
MRQRPWFTKRRVVRAHLSLCGQKTVVWFEPDFHILDGDSCAYTISAEGHVSEVTVTNLGVFRYWWRVKAKRIGPKTKRFGAVS